LKKKEKKNASPGLLHNPLMDKQFLPNFNE